MMDAIAKIKHSGKIMSLSEAASLVKDGDQVTLGGFTSARNSMTLAREIFVKAGKSFTR